MGKRGFFIMILCLLCFLSPLWSRASGKGGQEKDGIGYKQDIEYLFDLIEQTNLNVHIRAAL